MTADKPTFSLGQTVAYKGRLYRVVAAEIMGVTGWRYDLEDLDGRKVRAAYPHELDAPTDGGKP